MGYSKNVYEAVQARLYKFKSQAHDDLQKRRKFIYERFPRAEEIEKTLSSTAVDTAKAVLKGSNTFECLTRLRARNKYLKRELKGILESVNLPDDYLDMKHHCDTCKDEGYVDGHMCICMRNMMRREAYDRMNSMSPLSLSTFESFSLDYYSDFIVTEGMPSPKKRMSQIRNFCKDYAYNFKKGAPNLLMRGHTGLGKTHISLAIANEVINQGIGVIYISTPNLVSVLEGERFRGETSEGKQGIHFTECDLLIVDDLGTEFSTSFSAAAIYNVINMRIMLGRTTIINTNLSIKELEKLYSERLVSRIMGDFITLIFLGADIRQKRTIKKTF